MNYQRRGWSSVLLVRNYVVAYHSTVRRSQQSSFAHWQSSESKKDLLKPALWPIPSFSKAKDLKISIDTHVSFMLYKAFLYFTAGLLYIKTEKKKINFHIADCSLQRLFC
jgi:hypothetical protein